MELQSVVQYNTNLLNNSINLGAILFESTSDQKVIS
jgi:hypothetical protein